MSPEQWNELGVDALLSMPANVYKSVGCLDCRQTGFRGRSGVYELMAITPSIQSAIGDDPELLKALSGGLQVPTTSIFSRADGVVNWKTCLLRPSAAAEKSKNTSPAMSGLVSIRRYCGR